MAERAEITALHADHIQGLLERLGLAAAYERGELRCAICGEPVVTRGLGAVRLDEGPVVSCGKLECLEDFHE